MSPIKRQGIAVALFLAQIIFWVPSGFCFDWSNTELQYQYGNLSTPTFVQGGGKNETHVVTFQHASGWKYGDNFIFIDFLNDTHRDGFNDTDFYGEAYFNFSLSKIFDTAIKLGPINDFGFLAGVNMGADANVIKYLPGLRASWNIPGFAFLNTDFAAYIDDSGGVSSGGAPAESDSFWVDVNWKYPITVGDHHFSIEGHVEYVGERTSEFGAPVNDWFFGQPQFRYYPAGLTPEPDRVFIGVEWQFWVSKLGDPNTDENAAQLLLGWHF